MPAFREVLAADRVVLSHARRRDPEAAAPALCEALQRDRDGQRRRFRRPVARAARAARGNGSVTSYDARLRRLRRRAEVPARAPISSCCSRHGAHSTAQGSDRRGGARDGAHTLDRMALAGLYDQLGGGFYRYSVDRHWSIPHFEKMLYDNAALLAVYADAYAATGDAAVCAHRGETADLGAPRHARRSRRVLLHARRRLRARRRASSTSGRRAEFDARCSTSGESRLAKRVFGFTDGDEPNFDGQFGICRSRRRRRAAAALGRPRSGEAAAALRKRAREVARRARATGLAGPRREGARVVERAHDRRARTCRAPVGAARARGSRDARRRLHPRGALERRPAQGHVQGRARALRGLSRRLCVSSERAARAARSTAGAPRTSLSRASCWTCCSRTSRTRAAASSSPPTITRR